MAMLKNAVNRELVAEGFPPVTSLNTIRTDMRFIDGSRPDIEVIETRIGRRKVYGYVDQNTNGAFGCREQEHGGESIADGRVAALHDRAGTQYHLMLTVHTSPRTMTGIPTISNCKWKVLCWKLSFMSSMRMQWLLFIA